MGTPTECDNRISENSAAGAETVRVYPDLHAAAHAAGLDAAARLYLIARHMDRAGSGRLMPSELRTALEGRGLMTWRRIRQIMTAGAGIFWAMDPDGAIRLARPGRILKVLKVGRLEYRPVDIPAAALYGSIADYRAAAIYAGVLVGRTRPDAPISQAAIKEATGGLSERAQRRYRKSAAVTAVRTWRLSAADPTTLHNLLYEVAKGRRGRVAYLHHDRRGVLGPAGASYVAIQLPNVYSSQTIARGTRGRRRKIARELAPTLLSKAQQGKVMPRLYHSDSDAAWRGWSQSGGRGVNIYPVQPADGRVVVYWKAVGAA